LNYYKSLLLCQPSFNDNQSSSLIHKNKAQIVIRIPILVNANWPTEGKIRDRFSIRYIVFEVSGAEAKQADPAELMDFFLSLDSYFSHKIPQIR